MRSCFPRPTTAVPDDGGAAIGDGDSAGGSGPAGAAAGRAATTRAARSHRPSQTGTFAQTRGPHGSVNGTRSGRFLSGPRTGVNESHPRRHGRKASPRGRAQRRLRASTRPPAPPAGAAPATGVGGALPSPGAWGVSGTLRHQRRATTVAADAGGVSDSAACLLRAAQPGVCARPYAMTARRDGFTTAARDLCLGSYRAPVRAPRFSRMSWSRAFWGSANFAVPSSINFFSIFASSTFFSISSTTSRGGRRSTWRV